MAWMERPSRAGKAEGGFTLAGLLVIMTIMMIVVAYTVPRMWSTVVQREREQQTIFIMQQYARAIHEFSRKNGNALPASIDQIKEAKQPRYLRAKGGEYIDPLTGEVDWLIIPASAQGATGGPIPGTQGSGPTTTAGGTNNPNTTAPTVPGIPIKDYAGGPFIGVRSPKTGKAFIAYRGAENYEQWSYTVNDYRQDLAARLNAYGKLWQ